MTGPNFGSLHAGMLMREKTTGETPTESKQAYRTSIGPIQAAAQERQLHPDIWASGVRSGPEYEKLANQELVGEHTQRKPFDHGFGRRNTGEQSSEDNRIEPVLTPMAPTPFEQAALVESPAKEITPEPAPPPPAEDEPIPETAIEDDAADELFEAEEDAPEETLEPIAADSEPLEAAPAMSRDGALEDATAAPEVDVEAAPEADDESIPAAPPSFVPAWRRSLFGGDRQTYNKNAESTGTPPPTEPDRPSAPAEEIEAAADAATPAELDEASQETLQFFPAPPLDGLTETAAAPVVEAAKVEPAEQEPDKAKVRKAKVRKAVTVRLEMPSFNRLVVAGASLERTRQDIMADALDKFLDELGVAPHDDEADEGGE